MSLILLICFPCHVHITWEEQWLFERFPWKQPPKDSVIRQLRRAWWVIERLVTSVLCWWFEIRQNSKGFSNYSTKRVHTINTSCVILSNSYKKFADDKGCCREIYHCYDQKVKKCSMTQYVCLIKKQQQQQYVSYTLCGLIGWGCFSFEKCIRDGFTRKCVVFQDGEERTVPSVSGVWSFKSQH